MKDIFVLGLDPFHQAMLEAAPSAEGVALHPLLTLDEIRTGDAIHVREPLERAAREIEAFEGSVDGIIGYWDFPVNVMSSMLCERFGLPTASFDKVMRCEHKAWSRMIQQEAAPEAVPPFEVVDPFGADPVGGLRLALPCWIKPVIGYQSALGFLVRTPGELERALSEIRAGIGRIAEPLNWLLERCDCPEEAGGRNGAACIAEGLIRGRQCTVEGYVHEGEVTVYGVVDSIRYPGVSSFQSYRYPPLLPERIRDRVTETTARVMEKTGLLERGFNVEYFWDETDDRIWLLEINTRPSQSHADLFDKVDGCTNESILIDLALGRAPRLPHREGAYGAAGKFFVRRFEDATVTAAPTPEEIESIQRDHPGTRIEVKVAPGQRLSETPDRDSYSYELAWIHAGAEDHAALDRIFEDCAGRLRFGFEQAEDGSPRGGVVAP